MFSANRFTGDPIGGWFQSAFGAPLEADAGGVYADAAAGGGAINGKMLLALAAVGAFVALRMVRG